MSEPLKKKLLSLLKFGLPVAVIWYLVSAIKPDQWAQLKASQQNYGYLGTALLIGIVATFISYIRWCLLVRAHEIPLSYLDGIRLGTVGFMLNFVSPGSVGGDVFKAFFLAQRTPGKRIEAFATVLVDRIVGLYGLLVVASGALILIGDALPEKNAMWIQLFVYGATIGGALGMFGIVLGGRFIDPLLTWIGTLPLVGPFVQRIADPLRAFRNHPAVFMLTIAMAVLVHCILSAAIFFIARGLFDSCPTLLEHSVIVPLANAFAGIPLFPGGVGVFEAALQTLYETVPSPPTTASGTLVGLAYELVKIVIAAIGIVFYWTGGREVRDSLNAAQEEGVQDTDTQDETA